MADQQWRRCRWCNSSYILGTGEWKSLCSKKCQTQFYREYPGQAKADHEQDERDEAERKRQNEAFWSWFKIIVGGLILWGIIASN